MCDGAVIFMTDSIDAGDSTKPPVWIDPIGSRPGIASPYGVWGAMGTRASKEVIGEEAL